MAVTVNAAIYGVGIYGVARYDRIVVSNLDQVEATGQVNTVRVSTAAGLTGVVATGSVEGLTAGGFEVDISEKITQGVSGTGQVSAVQVNPSEKLTGVSATFTLNGEAVSVRSVNRVPITSVALTGFVDTVKENVLEPVGAVSATGFSGQVQVNVAEVLASVEATGSIGTLAFSNSFTVGSVQAQAIARRPEPKISEAVGGVSSEGFVNGVQVNTAAGISPPALVGSITATTQTAVVFNFEAVKETYSRQRTIFLPRAA